MPCVQLRTGEYYCTVQLETLLFHHQEKQPQTYKSKCLDTTLTHFVYTNDSVSVKLLPFTLTRMKLNPIINSIHNLFVHVQLPPFLPLPFFFSLFLHLLLFFLSFFSVPVRTSWRQQPREEGRKQLPWGEKLPRASESLFTTSCACYFHQNRAVSFSVPPCFFVLLTGGCYCTDAFVLTGAAQETE